jgi:hypothetical protein
MGLPEARLPDGSAEPTHPWLSMLGVGVSDKGFPRPFLTAPPRGPTASQLPTQERSKSASPQLSTGTESPMLMLVVACGNSFAIYLSRQRWVLVLCRSIACCGLRGVRLRLDQLRVNGG